MKQLRFVVSRERVAWKRERHRPHHRHAGCHRLGDRRLQVRKQSVAKREPLPRNGFGFGTKSPGVALTGAVNADVGTEHRGLKPAQGEFG